MATDPPTLLTTSEAAAHLRLSPRTLEAWRLRGGGPRYRKLGDRVLYTQTDLDAWLETQARTSTSDPGPAPGAPERLMIALPPRRGRKGR
jgi:excisionase family DNA binding protein